MMSNRLFSKTMGRDFKREISWLAIYALLFFFSLPITLMIGVEGAREHAYELVMSQTNSASATFQAAKTAGVLTEFKLMRLAAEVLGMGTSTVLLSCCAAAEAYHQFGFLHRRREVDFFHAFPQSRTQIFLGRLANGVLTPLLPYTACLLLGAVYALTAGAPAAKLAEVLLVAWAFNILLYLLFYVLCALAVMLTGRALTGLLGMAVLVGYFPFISLLLMAFSQFWFKTYVEPSWPFSFLLQLSPAAQLAYAVDWYQNRYYYIGNYYYHYEAGIPIALRAALCAAAVVLFALAAWALYRKRPLEKAGEAMAFRNSESVLRIALVLPAGMGGAAFFYGMRSQFGWAVFGLVAGVLLSHCLIEVIYRNDFRSLFAHKLQLAGCGLAGLLILCVFHYDLVGYDRWVPEPSDVDSVMLQVYNETNQNEYYVQLPNGSYDWVNYISEENWPHAALTSEEDIADVLAIAHSGVAALSADGEQTAHLSLASGTDGVQEEIGAAAAVTIVADAQTVAADDSEVVQEDSFPLVISYRLKNGREIKRSYDVPRQALLEDYASLYASANYKNSLYPILHTDAAQISGVSYYKYGEEQALNLNDEQRAEFLQAYRNDLLRLSMEERTQEYPIGKLNFVIGSKEEVVRKEPEIYEAALRSYSYGSGYVEQSCPVYPSFQETIALLKQYGIEIQTWQELFDGLASISYRVGTTQTTWLDDDFAEEALVWRSGNLTEAADIETVLANFVSDELNYNPFGPALWSNVWLGEDAVGDGSSLLPGGALLRNADTEALVEKMRAEGQEEP